jgi:hypothetical protein
MNCERSEPRENTLQRKDVRHHDHHQSTRPEAVAQERQDGKRPTYVFENVAAEDDVVSARLELDSLQIDSAMFIRVAAERPLGLHGFNSNDERWRANLERVAGFHGQDAQNILGVEK